MIFLSEFISNWKRNIFLAVILSVMAVIIVSVQGVLSFEKKRISPFLDMDNEKGYVISGYQFENIVKNPKVINATFFADTDIKGRNIRIYANGNWAMGCSPRLSICKYVTGAAKDGTIFAVIGGSGAEKYKIGDIIQAGQNTRFEITGIVVPGSSILNGGNSFKTGEVDYRMLYGVESDLFLLCGYESIKYSEIKFDYVAGGIVIVDDDMPEDEYKSVFMDVQLETSNSCLMLSDFISNSRKVYDEKILSYMPLVLVGVFVIIICCYAVIYINYMYGIKRYAIYYLVGCNRLYMVFISLCNSIGTTLFSIGITAMLYYEIEKKHMIEGLTLDMNNETVKMLVFFYLLFIASMFVMTLFSMRGRSPKEQIIRISK